MTSLRINAYFVVLLSFLFLFAQPVFAADLSPGLKAPDFTAATALGAPFKLSDHQGKYIVLEWTNHDCPFVRKHYDAGNMQRLQRKYTTQGHDVEIVWFSVISSAPGKQGHVTAEQARELTISRKAVPTDVLLDPTGKIGRLYGARTTPHMFIIKPDRAIAYMGAIDSIPSANSGDIIRADNYVELAFDALTAGGLPEPSSTTPYGCSVKY